MHVTRVHPSILKSIWRTNAYVACLPIHDSSSVALRPESEFIWATDVPAISRSRKG